MKIGILGWGKMGDAIAQGLKRSSNSRSFELRGSTRSQENAVEIAKKFSIVCDTRNEKLVEWADVVLLCVKPHQAQEVLQDVSKKFRGNQLLISVCASIPISQLSQWSGGKPAIVRAMPNTPCLIGQGMAVYCVGKGVQEKDLALVEEIFGTLGKTAAIEESLMDGATGLSGCGPAYVYLIAEALSEAGVKVGLSRQLSTLLAAQTLQGAAQMVLQRDVHPAALKDEVTTPAGCTIDGLMALEEGKLRVTLIKAVLAAAKRSKSLREAN